MASPAMEGYSFAVSDMNVLLWNRYIYLGVFGHPSASEQLRSFRISCCPYHCCKSELLQMRRATDFFSLLQVAWPLMIIWTKFTEKASWSDPNLFFQVPCLKCVVSYLSFFWKAPRIMRQCGLGISWTLLTNNSNGSSSCIALAIESIATPSDTASNKL